MSSIVSSYAYVMEMYAIIGDQEITIDPSSITYVVTNYNYDKNNAPIIYVNLNLNTEIYDKLVDNINNGSIVFTIYKYNRNSTSAVKKVYIRDRFTYIMSTDPSYDNEGVYYEDYNNQKYKKGTIMLVKMDALNNNKILINSIFKDTNMSSIIHHYTKSMTMVFEPLDNNPRFDYLIIPPIESTTHLLRYLNGVSCFYKSGYRYFRDFDKTYLLSRSGKCVECEDTDLNTVLIEVANPMKPEAVVNSIGINQDAGCYVINVDAERTNIDIDVLRDKSFNTIMGVTSLGNVGKLELEIPKDVDGSEKIKLYRLFNENSEYLENIKNVISSDAVMIHITKTELDSSIITPNKEYQVRNFHSYSQYDGRYALSYKKEVFVKETDEYISSVIFGLRRIVE